MQPGGEQATLGDFVVAQAVEQTELALCLS